MFVPNVVLVARFYQIRGIFQTPLQNPFKKEDKIKVIKRWFGI